MKAKLKGANGFVRFLLQHGEKLGMAAILVVAGLLIYSSLGRPSIESNKQPVELQTKANQAKSHVEQMSWDGFPVEERTDASLFIQNSGDGARRPVNPQQYPPGSRWNPPVIDEVMQRLDPVLVTVADLEVTAGAGLWMQGDPEVIRRKMIELAQAAARAQREADEESRRMAEEAEDERGGRRGRGRGPGGEGGFGAERGGFGGAEMGGMKTKDGALVIPPTGGAQMQGIEDIREKAWVTVLAKIPIKQQFQMYADALATARGFNVNTDQPIYLGYLIERAEVTDAGTGKYVQLPAVTEPAVVKKMATWPIQTPDAINPKYNHPLLTYPLPPMVMRTWGEEVTHSDMPLPTPEDLMAETMEATQAPAQPEEEQDPSDPWSGAAARRAQAQPGNMMGGEMMGRGMGARGMMGGEMMGRGGMGMGMRGGMAEGGRGMMGGGMMGGMGSDGTIDLPDYAWDGKTKELLFRFFDDTVEPGRRYRYRVKLVLMDVNATQPEQFLDPAVSMRLAKEKEASAAKTKKPGKANNYRTTEWSEPSPVAVVPQPGLIYIAQTKDVNSTEPEARIIVKSVDSTNAAEVGLQNWFTRGSVLNFKKQAQIIWSSLYKVDPAKPEDSPMFSFLTGLTLVDFDGGDQLTSKSKSLTAPARVLVMDPSGRLSFQNELDAGTAVLEYDYIMKQSDEAARRARESATEGGRGGGGRGRPGR